MQLVTIKNKEDIPTQYQNTPVEDFLLYHNLEKPYKKYEKAQVLVGMCMDHRKQLKIPENFAYIIRTGGGNLRYSEFKVSYAVAVGGVKYIILIAHDDCGMVNLASKKDKFVNGLVENAGWDRKRAEEHFLNFAPMFEIDNEIEFTFEESERIMKKYQGIVVVPCAYDISSNKVKIIESI